METITYYDILGIASNASQEEVKKAYRRMVFKYHNDRNRDPQALPVFYRVTKAYKVLSDPAERKEYDRNLAPIQSVQEVFFRTVEGKNEMSDMLPFPPAGAKRGSDVVVVIKKTSALDQILLSDPVTGEELKIPVEGVCSPLWGEIPHGGGIGKNDGKRGNFFLVVLDEKKI
jgi:curved DNA-binding protein CbpA